MLFLQSEMVRDYIKEQHPGLDVEILTMKTTGDKILDRTLDKVGGKGLFEKTGQGIDWKAEQCCLCTV